MWKHFDVRFDYIYILAGGFIGYINWVKLKLYLEDSIGLE